MPGTILGMKETSMNERKTFCSEGSPILVGGDNHCDYWMYLVVKVLRSKIEVEHEGRECGWAYYFDGVVREASLTMCG